MEDQERRIEEQSNGDGPEENAARAEKTQQGQVMHALARATRQMPAHPRRELTAAHVANDTLRERILTLVGALADPGHPLHHQAVDELVAIGAPAVPALNEALNPHRPWLTAYRAAEALGRIGDGRAAGPLLEALHHPNSNVRWSAVRALAVVGDARALLELRRVARDDRGKTSWGEPVAGAAQSALNQMQSQYLILRGADLLKTAVACVVMLVSLILAWSVITTLRAELKRPSREAPPAALAVAPTAAAEATPQPTLEATPAPTVAPTPVATPVITGTVVRTANVRGTPGGVKVGGVSEGDEIIFLGTTPDRQWYLIKLGERFANGSRIDSSDGSGWVHFSLLSQPNGEVKVEEAGAEQPSPAPPTGI